MFVDEIKENLENVIIPFWNGLRDDEFGGFYGLLDADLMLDKKADKGGILHNRILWFYSNAYLTLKQPELLEYATHTFQFVKEHCVDKEHGGIYWSVTYDGKPKDTTKHTYNIAFAIYALSSYYAASKDEEALKLAYTLFHVIEDKCTDEYGYLEASTIDFKPESNEKLSENGIIAEKTMNTLLHVFEAYTELYRVDQNQEVAKKMRWILDCFHDQVYNKEGHRLEVFFDQKMNTLIDLHSYGHDIESAWLLDRGLEILNDKAYSEKMADLTKDLEQMILKTAYHGECVDSECEKGIVNTARIWWVQCEAIIGFYNAYQKQPEKKEYLDACEHIWQFVKEHIVDKRPNSEWLNEINVQNIDVRKEPIAGPWKCPYHNGRMCFEMIHRTK